MCYTYLHFYHQAALVHTAETTRVRFFIDKLIAMQRPVMLVGPAGSGKTVLMGDKLAALGDVLAEVDVNPVIVNETGAIAVDALVVGRERRKTTAEA